MSSRGMLELLRLAEIGRKRKHNDQLDVENTWSGIGFRIQDLLFVTPIGEIEEVLNVPQVTAVPGVRDFLLGVVNIRGKIITLNHLGRLFRMTGYTGRSHQRLMLVNYPPMPVGLVADEVFGLKHFARGDYRRNVATSGMTPELEQCIDGSFFAGQQQWRVFLPSRLVKFDKFYEVNRA